ncbi:MAG: type VI secretion system tube protein Hcp [Thermoplasmata archaeon]|nr:MAG: type VI secretion system tube protein Hcp [Thermoplasmata archaeon]
MNRIRLLVAVVFVTLIVSGMFNSTTVGTDNTACESAEQNVPVDPGYIKFGDIKGESTDKNHQGWCDLLGFSQVITNTGIQSAGKQISRPDFELFEVYKKIDMASPKLMEVCVRGTSIDKVLIEFTKIPPQGGGFVVYYEIELGDVYIVEYRIGSPDVNVEPIIEEMVLEFREIKVTYTEYDDSGQPHNFVEFEWKLEYPR